MPEREGLMAGKRGLIMGVANDRSIAWGIARAAHGQGAELGFTFQGEALEKRVRPLAQSLGSDLVLPCDVASDESIESVFAAVEESWGALDFLVHAIAYADKDELKGKYLNTSRENFVRSLDISCYSFTAVAQRAAAMMRDGGSLLTLTYYGAERVMPHYNVMGVAKAALEASVRYLASDLGKDRIRVNAISAGPIKTLAASGIGDVSLDQVGGAAVYLLSDLSNGVTGEVHHVDSGYHVVGMMAVDAAPEVSQLLQGLSPQS
jgi:enoyl-[acyl-carrier protein] reductase I